MKKIACWLCLLLCCLLLTQPGRATDAAAELTLADAISQLQAQYGLTAENFSLCYYNTVTKERYSFSADRWMIAASTYKLPLNLYYYEQEAAGAIDPEMRIAGRPLSEIHYESIVNSNNELSEALIYHLGTFRQYKEQMFASFGHLAPEEIADITWTGNYYTTGFLCDTLQYLYENADRFPQLLAYLKEAQPEAYFKKYVTQYPIAHKYGSFDGAENDVGIVYTAEPYLLAVYTYGLADGEEVVARVNEAVCRYNTEKAARASAAAREAARLAKLAADEQRFAQTAREPAEALPQAQQPAYLQDLSPVRLGALLALGAAAGLLLWQLVHHRRKRTMHS